MLCSGCSLAAPQVAGILGYMMTSPASANAQPTPECVAMGCKSQILAPKRRDPAFDALWGAYNGVREIKSSQTTPRRKALEKILGKVTQSDR